MIRGRFPLPPAKPAVLLLPVNMLFSLHLATQTSTLIPSIQVKGQFKDIHLSFTSNHYRSLMRLISSVLAAPSQPASAATTAPPATTAPVNALPPPSSNTAKGA